MIYITVKQPQKYHQVTLEELLSGVAVQTSYSAPESATYTRVVSSIPAELFTKVNADSMKMTLDQFNKIYDRLRLVDRHELYDTFFIPKKSGGLRRIDAPKPELMDALRRLKFILETEFSATHHTSAFAYIHKRSTIDALKKHQQNESKWFAKFDLHDFFGSTTLEFVMTQLSMIYPFCVFVQFPGCRDALSKALELAFLDGKLPQGTPISPMLTNLMMIPIDHILSNKLYNFNDTRFVYTRYADDFLISSRKRFDFRQVEGLIIQTLNEFRSPFQLNTKKTRYGSSAGSNWNLGLMLNKENQITVGHQRKHRIISMLHNYAMDRKNGITWSLEDIQSMAGEVSYLRMVEPEAANGIMEYIRKKTGIDVQAQIKSDLRQ